MSVLERCLSVCIRKMSVLQKDVCIREMSVLQKGVCIVERDIWRDVYQRDVCIRERERERFCIRDKCRY